MIPDDKLEDLDYVSQKIRENREVSLSSRAEIRKYGIEHFSWDVRVKHIYELYKIMSKKV